jgi:RNA polymerase sigma factor (sigma-70 family)
VSDGVEVPEGVLDRDVSAGRAVDDGELQRVLGALRPKLGGILASFRIPPQDADDLLQNVLLQYVKKRSLIREPELWLPGALRNECRMYWRTRSRSFTTAVDSAILETVCDEAAAPPQERTVMRNTLSRWIGELHTRCRSILRLRYHLGYEAREVAEETGYSPSSIDKVTRRCLEALGRKVAAAQPAPAHRKGPDATDRTW